MSLGQGQQEDRHCFHSGLGAVKAITRLTSCHLPGGGRFGHTYNTSDPLLPRGTTEGQRWHHCPSRAGRACIFLLLLCRSALSAL